MHTGGGTAGHVLPALAVAEGLVAHSHTPATIPATSAHGRGIETRLLPDTPVPAHLLRRRRVPTFAQSPQPGVHAPKMFRARREAIGLLQSCSPKWSWRRQAPALVGISPPRHSTSRSWSSARPAPRPAGEPARSPARRPRPAVAFPDSPLPRATMTGAPVRQAVLDVEPGRRFAPMSRRQLGVPDDRFLVAVMGGCTGSGRLRRRRPPTSWPDPVR